MSDQTRINTQAVHPPVPEIPGYRTLSRLGAGGMAEVWLAEDEDGNRVAVKVILPSLGNDPDFEARFAGEASTVWEFKHDNVIKAFPSRTADGRRCIIMELLEGGSLEERLSDGPLDPATARDIARAIASALSYAHSRGVTHRDLKPGNVLFTKDGVPVLSDFGVAKRNDSGLAHTVEGASIGTLLWMAPEQALGRPVESAADLYAWALVLIQMLTGAPEPTQSPVRDVSSSKRRKALTDRLSAYGGEELVPLLERCLSPSPQERPTAEECARALERKGRRDRSGHGITRRLVVAVGAVLGASLVVAILWVEREPPGPDMVEESRDALSQESRSETASMKPRIDRSRLPEGARIFVDDLELNHPEGVLPESFRRVVVVADGHFGAVLGFDELASRTEVFLPPVGSPTFSEWSRLFVDDESARSGSAEVERIVSSSSAEAATAGYASPMLQAIVGLEWAEKNDPVEFDRTVQDLETLAERRDAAAAGVLAFHTREPAHIDLLARALDGSRNAFAAAIYAVLLPYADGGETSELARRLIQTSVDLGLDPDIAREWSPSE